METRPQRAAQHPAKHKERSRRVLRPLDARRLDEMAVAYVARFATSAAKLDAYLRRKLRERGWEDQDDPPLAAIVAKCVAAGYVDEAAFAHAKSGALLRRGYGMRRIGEALGAAGVAEPLRREVRASAGARIQRNAALAMARKRRFGPFGPGELDRASREKQVGALLRAGHPLDSARELVNAASIEAAENWAAQPDGDE